jgi:hypothetical protein
MRNLEENWLLARQAEEKRATIAHIALILAFLILGALFLTGSPFLPFLLIFLGLYGLLTTAKLYERSQYHILRARKIRARLGELCPDAQLEMLYQSAEETHEARYPRLVRVRLSAIWQGMYIAFLVLGTVLSLFTLVLK